MKSSALARWMRWLHTYSAMLVLLLLLFFAITGITLNHPELSSSAGKTSQQLQLELTEHTSFELRDQATGELLAERRVKVLQVDLNASDQLLKRSRNSWGNP